MFLRIFALGFAQGRNTYLRSGWNVLDGSLVLFSWVYILLKLLWPDSALINPSILRIIRCLRPLRTAGFVRGVQSGLNSWPYLLNLWLLLVFGVTMFGVLGVQMFGGALTYQCLGPFPDGDDSLDCSDDSAAACNECVAAASLEQCSTWGVDCSCYDVPAEPGESAEVALQLLREQRTVWLELNRTAISCPKQVGCPTGICAPEPATFHWGFDNIGIAMLTCGIATTGDQAVDEMLPALSSSVSSFSIMTWPFFIVQAIILNLVISNLFAAVIVHAFLDDSAHSVDVRSLEDKIRKERTLFNRLDADKSGEITVDEIDAIVEILDLDEGMFADYELEEAKCETPLYPRSRSGCRTGLGLAERTPVLSDIVAANRVDMSTPHSSPLTA